MWPPAYLARWRKAGASGGAPVGPAMATVRSVAARTALTIRCIAVGYIALQVIIWHSFYGADPRRLAGPAVAVAWAAVIVARLRRSWPGWQLAGLDTGGRHHVAGTRFRQHLAGRRRRPAAHRGRRCLGRCLVAAPVGRRGGRRPGAG